MPGLHNLYLDTDGLRVGSNQLYMQSNTMFIGTQLVLGTVNAYSYQTPIQYGSNTVLSITANSPTPYWGAGAIDLRVGTVTGRVGMTFSSNVNSGSDLGYLYFYDNNNTYTTAGGESALLLLGISNDNDDVVAVEAAGSIFLNPGCGGTPGGFATRGLYDASGPNLYVGNNSVRGLVAHELLTTPLNMRTTSFTVNGAILGITKSFEIDHPTKPGMRLRYGSLEGPENGVYVRGRSQTDTIDLPDYWTGLVHQDSITVNLTGFGSPQSLYVKQVANNRITVASTDMTQPLDYFFTVYGERKDVAKLVVEE